MSLKKNEETKTPRERARTAILGIVARLAGCAYLTYIMIKLYKEAAKPDSGVSPTTSYIISGVLLAATVAVLVLTIVDFVKGVKEHAFDSQRYYDEEFMRQGLTMEEIEEIRDRCDETGETMEDVIRERELQKLMTEAESSQALPEGADAGNEQK